MSLPSNYNLYCTVCKNFYGSPTNWLTHLPEGDHQRRARLACRRWGTSVKDCVVVAFGSCSLAECGIIQNLSNTSYPRCLVTDFIYWKRKPNIALVQFESRATVDDVLKRTNAEIKVGTNGRVQLKRASDYLELEWNVLLSLKGDSKVDEDVWDAPDLSGTEIKREKGSNENTCKDIDDGGDEISINNSQKKTKKRKSINSNVASTTASTSILTKKRKTKHSESNGEKPTTKGKRSRKKTTVSLEVCDRSEEQNEVDCLIVERLNETPAPLVEPLSAGLRATINDVDKPNGDPIMSLEETQIVEIGLAENIAESSSNTRYEETLNAHILTLDEPACEDEIITLSSDSEPENDTVLLKTNIQVTTERKIEDKSSKSNLTETLRQQYVSIFKDILIPKDSFDAAVDLIDVLATEFKKTVPCCQIIPFRNWYLGIRTCGNNELLLFLDYRGIWDTEEWNDTAWADDRKPPVISTFFSSPQHIFPDIVKTAERNTNPRSRKSKERFGVGFFHKPSGLRFRVICSIFLLQEVQTCLLAEYLCLFDSKVLPLLGLVNYWFNLNSLMLANFYVTDSSKTFVAPAPASVDWLVLVFLMKKKLIPSARAIFERPHNKIVFRDVEIGFSNDLDFPQIWSSSATPPLQIQEQITRLRNTEIGSVPYKTHNILGILKLAREFFSFYGRYHNLYLKHTRVELNPKTGDIVTNGVDKEFCSEEITVDKTRISEYQKIILFHPIDVKFSFSFHAPKFPHVIAPLMNSQSDKIAYIIQRWNNGKKNGLTIADLDLPKLLTVWRSSSGNKNTKRIKYFAKENNNNNNNKKKNRNKQQSRKRVQRAKKKNNR